MFSGKKEKALEEELRAVKEDNAQKDALLGQLLEKQDEITEQFARVTASRAQMEGYMEQLLECGKQAAELAAAGEHAAEELHSSMVGIHNSLGTFEVNHSVFLRQKKEQDEKIMEIVENNKHFTTPMKYISETPSILKEEHHKIHTRIGNMQELSKNMGVMSLNAAIEAGRMGEVGTRFVSAAEEIRSFSENYEKEARELEEQLTKSENRVQELEEQVHHLNELLKDNNISMGKLLKESMMSTGTYESGQLELATFYPENAVGKTDTLLQSEQQTLQMQEMLQQQMKAIQDEVAEQKNSMDELETILKGLTQSANRGKYNGRTDDISV